MASGASLPKRATALFVGRDPLRFSGISLKISGFWHFQIIFFLENDPGCIKNSKVSKKPSEIKYLELDLIFAKIFNQKYPTIKKLQIFYTSRLIFF